MKLYALNSLCLLVLVFLATPAICDVPLLTVSDTINPGTADYIVSQIALAEREGAPFIIIQMDTPGGLLTSTRQIIQQMLNSKLPVVVFVSPRGAHAGSAGALITFAADIAAMAPSTNIGAAHPVVPGGEKMDKTMDDKITNDTAAFAESIAKSKGRNTSLAIKTVRKSAAIIADEALNQGLIDLIAEDLPDLMKKLAGFQLKVPKQGISRLPTETLAAKNVKISIRQSVVSFFADPNLAYLIMSLGGLCLWIELSHPGLIFPGVLGSICIILSLISFQTLPIHYGALAMIFLGMGLIISELFFPAYGVLGVGGLVCFVFGSLFLMDTGIPEFQISMKLVFPTAAVLATCAFLLGVIVLKSRRAKLRSGLESLVGEVGEARAPISAGQGKVFVHGELWNAVTNGSEISPGHRVVVTEVRNMLLVVEGQ